MMRRHKDQLTVPRGGCRDKTRENLGIHIAFARERLLKKNVFITRAVAATTSQIESFTGMHTVEAIHSFRIENFQKDEATGLSADSRVCFLPHLHNECISRFLVTYIRYINGDDNDIQFISNSSQKSIHHSPADIDCTGNGKKGHPLFDTTVADIQDSCTTKPVEHKQQRTMYQAVNSRFTDNKPTPTEACNLTKPTRDGASDHWRISTDCTRAQSAYDNASSSRKHRVHSSCCAKEGTDYTMLILIVPGNQTTYRRIVC